MTLTYGPWHTLTIASAVWYCEKPLHWALCLDPEGHCHGHETQAPGRTVETDWELEHPADCPIPPCCCRIPAEERYPGFETDPECAADHHDNCLNRGPRCYTEENLRDWWDVSDMPTVPGVWRLRVWGSGPDYNGEYDGGIEHEPVSAQVGEPA